MKTDDFKTKIVSNGTIVKFVSIPDLKKMKINIPKNKQHIQNLEATFKQIETLNDQVKHAEELYKKYIQELSQEAFPQQQPNNIQVEASNVK